jgi:hypothetical protein
MKVNGNGGTVIVTDCGHQYNSTYSADQLAGASTDCQICGNLLLFDNKLVGNVVRARDFHDVVWAPYGVKRGDTFYVEF